MTEKQLTPDSYWRDVKRYGMLINEGRVDSRRKILRSTYIEKSWKPGVTGDGFSYSRCAYTGMVYAQTNRVIALNLQDEKNATEYMMLSKRFQFELTDGSEGLGVYTQTLPSTAEMSFRSLARGVIKAYKTFKEQAKLGLAIPQELDYEIAYEQLALGASGVHDLYE